MDYYYIDGVQIFNTINNTDVSIQKIVNNTVNTWQPNRGINETTENTLQGKVAEYGFERYVSEYDNFLYKPYDKFRNDEFKKHAPFDGLIYKKKNTAIDSLVEDILLDVENDAYGRISLSTRNKLRENKVYTVEIKSTKVSEKKINCSVLNGQLVYKNLIEEIKKDDFLYYPHYTRKSNTIKNFDDYCIWVKNNIPEFNAIDYNLFINRLMEVEVSHANNILVRIYVLNDNKNPKTLIIGYLLREELFSQHQIKHFYQEGKSELPIYYYCSLKNGRTCNMLFSDDRIW